jgi:membrane-associated phospholipid phosphatase
MKIRSFLILIAFFSSAPAWSQNPDIRILRSIYLERNEKLEPGFLFITHSTSTVSIMVPVSQIGYGFIYPDKTVLQNGYIAGASFLLANIVSYSLKYAVDRDRPYITYPDIKQEAQAETPSFPSGHTTIAFATATSLSLAYPKWYVVVPSFAWAGAVGYSRMYLGVHYPGDVLAGAIIGSGTAFLCYKVGKKIPN